MQRGDLPPEISRTITAAYAALADRICEKARGRSTPLVVGFCGAQGSGKTTLTACLEPLLAARGLTPVVLSLDDLYLTRAERSRLAQDVHPLLSTRGVPGTHDVALAVATLERIGRPGTTRIPVFDKATDDRLPASRWRSIEGPSDIVLFEGWCVGAKPQSAAALAEPLNALERDEDPHGIWRRYVNDALAGPYQGLFARIDLLILLQAPSFDVVYAWRGEQEEALRRTLTAAGDDASSTLDDAQLRRFIAHYERLTKHILAEMPARADVVIELDAARRPSALREALR